MPGLKHSRPRRYRTWTKLEDSILKDRVRRGIPIKEIARMLDREPKALYSRRKILRVGPTPAVHRQNRTASDPTSHTALDTSFSPTFGPMTAPTGPSADATMSVPEFRVQPCSPAVTASMGTHTSASDQEFEQEVSVLEHGENEEVPTRRQPTRAAKQVQSIEDSQSETDDFTSWFQLRPITDMTGSTAAGDNDPSAAAERTQRADSRPNAVDSAASEVVDSSTTARIALGERTRQQPSPQTLFGPSVEPSERPAFLSARKSISKPPASQTANAQLGGKFAKASTVPPRLEKEPQDPPEMFLPSPGTPMAHRNLTIEEVFAMAEMVKENLRRDTARAVEMTKSIIETEAECHSALATLAQKVNGR